MEDTRKSVVYVNDLHFNLISIKSRLKKRYEIFIAHSVEKMFDLLDHFTAHKDTNPDLILLDLNIPDVDGFQAIKELKHDARYATIPVVFLSSKRDKTSITKAMDLGAVDYVTKPFSDAELVECIEYQLDPDMRKANRPIILAIDDNPGILKSVKHVLDDQYRVHLLQEPQIVREILKKITPDLFLLDCNMPELNGFDLVPIIREFSAHRDTPIVFLTSEGMVDNISIAVYLGASDFIVKPIDEAILRQKTAAHLSDYVLRRRLRHVTRN